VILGYHRVADPGGIVGGDPFALCVSPDLFRRQMGVLRAIGRPVSLTHLAEAMRAGISVRGMIGVTFDDAYEDVLEDALPALEEHRIPATVYFVSGNSGQPFWWDVLTGLLTAVDLSVPFRVQVGKCEIAWNGMGSPDALRVRLHRAIRILEEEEREEMLERLTGIWKTRPGGFLPRAVDEAGGRRLLRSSYVDPGVHTITHPPLAEVSPRRARAEIHEAREQLEDRYGCEFPSFSYPHGSRNRATARYVEEAGYRTACAAHPDSVRPGTDVLALPRVWATNRTIGAFKRRLRLYIGSDQGHRQDPS
jgi:peptidoglycan/xylan/chitin deacetylase (PgdA/CDA1 family)